MKRIREGERNGEIPQVKVKKEGADQQPQEKQMRTLTADARAQLVVQNDKISFDTKLHVFNVKGLSGVTRVVTLFPRPSCSCPSTAECYHILAAKLIMGMSVSTSQQERTWLSFRGTQGAKRTRRAAGKSHEQRMWSLRVRVRGMQANVLSMYCTNFTCLMFFYRWKCLWQWCWSSRSTLGMPEWNRQAIW